MMDRVRLFDRFGMQIDEIRATVERAWGLNTQTSGSFRVSYADAKCTPSNLEYGNWVLVENSDGLPDWVGMIDLREPGRDGVKITAFSPEVVFDYRIGPRSQTLAGSPGSVFAQMIDYINAQEETVLQAGNIESSGSLEETLNPVALSDDLNRIVERSGQGYRWRPDVDLGQLTIYGDWYADMTLDTGLILHDGYNIGGLSPIRESPPVSHVLAYGNGSLWSNRLIAEAQDLESRDRYGLRQVSFNVQTPSMETLTAAAQQKLNMSHHPAPAFSLNIANVGDTFKKIAPGVQAVMVRIVAGSFFGVDLTDQVKILNMHYDPENGYVTPNLLYEVKND
jgi:hypothetical protein